jgi:ABC-2 type transport system ATP-binding protein
MERHGAGSSPASSYVVEARNLKKTYASVEAVVDISFAMAAGEVVCLLGPNGAGKSTTVRILATLTRADEGTAVVVGHDVRNRPRAVRAAIGYVAQSAGTDVYLTGRENLLVQAAAHRMSRADARRRAAELLTLVGLADAANRTVGTYSGGMRRRLEIAMGIVHNPRLLFLDEPTTGLDPEARARMWGELGRLRAEQNLSILLTTHYLEEADQLADRVVIISQGRVVVEGTPESLKAGLAGDSITIELAGQPSSEAVRAALARVGTPSLVLEGNLLRGRLVEGNRALPGVLAALESVDVHVDSASIARPTLDDVYLHHTGRSFTIEESAPELEVSA